MKLSERITLLKAGYSKDEINSMLVEDAETSEQSVEVQNDTNNSEYIKILSVLANEVKDLKDAVYSSNITNTNIDSTNKVIKAEDILGSLINPKNNEEE